MNIEQLNGAHLNYHGEYFLKVLNAFGLPLSSNTGGALYEGIQSSEILHGDEKYEITLRCGEKIRFIAPSLFLKGIQETEVSTKFTLFEKP
jgi:hypothetical protein